MPDPIAASDIPHWDGQFPGNLEHLLNHSALSVEVKEKSFTKTPSGFLTCKFLGAKGNNTYGKIAIPILPSRQP